MSYVVLSDIDGCIIDGKGQMNENMDELVSAIRALKSEGHIFGLNSNRGLTDIMKFEFAEEADLIIAEAGAFMAWSVRELEYAKKIDFQHPDVQKARIEDVKNRILQDGCYMDVERAYGVSIYCLKKGKPDIGSAQRLEAVLKKQHPKNLTWSKENGHVWSLSSECDKASAFEDIKNYARMDIVMIGHDEGDRKAFEKSDICLCPRNTTLEANYISDHEYTRGVIDCLRQV